ncbi:gamma-glutamyltransferase family protein, partial [Roseovarius sp.]|uniref:gamma-glutamyltransferase family protein n=1 Tax=Roseovarius sp. TaxID=1486281 RepID=UPI00356B455E
MGSDQTRHRDWRKSAGTQFQSEKSSATGANGMVVTNHPLASGVGAEMLAAGGNAVDAAIASLFTLTVVEPMMVGIFGGGVAHIRMASGEHLVLDGLSAAPRAATPDMYQPVSDDPERYMEVEGRQNERGPRAIATPGSLHGWCSAQARFGRLTLAEVMDPAIRHARNGFAVTPYLAGCIAEAAPDLARDPEISRLLLPDGHPLAAGDRLVMRDYADTLSDIAREGPELFYGGRLGARIADHFAKAGGLITMEDLKGVATVERKPVEGIYRGHQVFGPPPPSAGGVHMVQMLNLLEGYDVAGMGYGSADAMHVLGEVLKIAFSDRAAATADPAFVNVPVDRLVSKDYADERRARIEMGATQDWPAGVLPMESPNTTHVSVADREGNIVSSTQTINTLFGAGFIIPGT